MRDICSLESRDHRRQKQNRLDFIIMMACLSKSMTASSVSQSQYIDMVANILNCKKKTNYFNLSMKLRNESVDEFIQHFYGVLPV